MIRTTQNRSFPLVLLALATAAPAAHAAYASAAAMVYATDTQSPGSLPVGPLNDSHASLTPPLAAASLLAVSGNSTARADAQANGLTGVGRALFTADVGAPSAVIGRSASAGGGFSMDGSIRITGSGPGGPATFSALLEGVYNVVGPLPSFDSRVELSYGYYVGTSPQMQGQLQYICCTAGVFAIPLNWTQTVQAGDDIAFSFYLNGRAQSVAGTSKLDVSNTFRITGIDLPAGFGYTPDAGGFLSQFAAPVPEPAAGWLMASGLIGLAAVARRQRGT